MENLSIVSIDTNLFIYYFENISPWSGLVESLITRQSPKTVIIASSLLFTELLVAPMKHHASHLVEVYTHLEQFIEHITILPFTRDIAIYSASLRAHYGISTPDAIHIATAIHGGASIFYTADKRIPHMKEIQIQQINEKEG